MRLFYKNQMTNTEHHPAWLAAMGVTQWQLRDAAIAAESATAAVEQEWPAHMLNATYWLAGAPLDDASETLLHAIMAAIGVDMADVVYCSNDAILNLALSVPESVRVLDFGAVANAWQGHQIALPSLSDMLAQPERKRDAWAVLKPLTHVIPA